MNVRATSAPVGLRLLLAIVLFSPICGGQPANSRQEEPAAGRDLTEEQAKAAEEKLQSDPDNLTLRAALIRYYFRAMLASRKEDIEAKREPHIFWLIEHHPDSRLAGSPEARIDPIGFMGSVDSYQHGKELWLAQAEKHPDSARVLENAAAFVSLHERKLGRELLEKALALDPTNLQAASLLAQSYDHERMYTQSPEEKVALSQKALSIRERALDRAQGPARFYALADAATEALEAGETAKAEQYAVELLQSAKEYRRGWNYGNAIHKGHIILGRIALRRDDIEGAKQHLLAAGETPGSPQLNSFGPNMTLAKELLEKGERDTVAAYLESCSKFWKMGKDQLQGWIATVKSGGIPDFGANLVY